MHQQMDNKNYYRFLVMIVLHFIAMYFLMYAMVDTFSNVFTNFNQFYMAGLMTSSMGAIELVLMGAMYHNKKLNLAIIGVSVIALFGFFFLIRQQTAIGDIQFLRSMIPHHAGAILMAEQASVQDPEIRELMRTIIESQQAEIDQMKSKLDELER